LHQSISLLLLLLLLPFYGHYTGQPTHTPSAELEDFVGVNFTAHMLLMATCTFK